MDRAPTPVRIPTAEAGGFPVIRFDGSDRIGHQFRGRLTGGLSPQRIEPLDGLAEPGGVVAFGQPSPLHG
jgi:hypothetical protein